MFPFSEICRTNQSVQDHSKTKSNLTTRPIDITERANIGSSCAQELVLRMILSHVYQMKNIYRVPASIS